MRQHWNVHLEHKLTILDLLKCTEDEGEECLLASIC